MTCWSKETLRLTNFTRTMKSLPNQRMLCKKKLITRLWMCISRLLKKWTNNSSNTTPNRTVINKWMSCSVISRDRLNRVQRVKRKAFSAISTILNLKWLNIVNGSTRLNWILVTKIETFLWRQIWQSIR